MAHAVVHFDIGGPDDRQLAEFYAGLLGWSMRPVQGVDYTLVDTCGGDGINGGVVKAADGEPSVAFYVQTDDLQAVLDKVNLLGGKTVTPITELPGMVTFAKFEDLDGLIIGLVLGPADPGTAAGGTTDGAAQAVPGQLGPGQVGAAQVGAAQLGSEQSAVPGPSAGTGAPVDWFEVLGSDADRSQRFYTEIFGWQIKDAGPGYRMVDTGSAWGIRGGIGGGQEGIWATVYARVLDVEAALTTAVELGGAREVGPIVVDDHMQTGALRDPAGNVFGVYSHVPH